MSRSKFILSISAALAIFTVVSVADATAVPAPPVENLRPDIRVTFDNESFTPVRDTASVHVPVVGGTGAYDDCYLGDADAKVICNSATSGFGSDDNGSYWQMHKELDAQNGGIVIDPNTPITNQYTIAVTFSIEDDATTGYRHIISPSAVRADSTYGTSDNGVYVEHKTVDETPITQVVNYGPVNMDQTNTRFSTASGDPDVITLISTRSDDGRMCLFMVKSGGAVIRLVECGTDEGGDQINDGMIGLFQDDSGEVADNAKIYDVRIWDRPLNQRQLGKVYAGPTASRNIVVTQTGRKTRVTWDAPIASSGITQYTVEFMSNADYTGLVTACNVAVRSCTKQLSPGVYWVNVQAKYGDAGFGDASPLVRFEVVRTRPR